MNGNCRFVEIAVGQGHNRPVSTRIRQGVAISLQQSYGQGGVHLHGGVISVSGHEVQQRPSVTSGSIGDCQGFGALTGIVDEVAVTAFDLLNCVVYLKVRICAIIRTWRDGNRKLRQ